MNLEQVRDIAMANQKSLIAFDEWAEGIERRVDDLEKGNSVLMSIQLALKELSINYKHFGEKLDDMKNSLEKFNEENNAQHADLSARIKKIEDAPGDKWNKAVWILVTAGLMAASAGLTKLFAP